MDWQGFRLFLVAARHRSLRSAAADLGLSLPTLSRQLTAFEDGLGLRLILRTPRGIRLTEQGEALLKAGLPSLGRMAEIERLAARLATPEATPALRISTTEPIAAEILASRIEALFTASPGVPVELRIENSVISLALNQADIAIRLARPEGGSLMAKRVALLRMGLYASRERAAAIAGREITALREEHHLGYDDTYGPIPERRWIDEQGLAGKVVLRTSSTRTLLNAAAAGAGFAILPAILADRHSALAEVRLASGIGLQDRPIWAVWHRDRNQDRSVRAAIVWISDCFRAAAQPNRPSAGNVSSNQ